MDPLGYREPNSMQLSATHMIRRGKLRSLRSDDIVARIILRDALIHPVRATKGNIMGKFMFRCVQMECVRRRDWKRTKYMLARCGEVINYRLYRRERRPFSFNAGRAGGRRRRNRRLVAPESTPASPGHAHQRIVDVNPNHASSSPRLR